MKYDGDWKNDRKHGFGKETLSNGSQYEEILIMVLGKDKVSGHKITMI
ncbi:MAG: MORN repeat-containing protein [Streptococcus sp.]|nr:MORN repeat-containing protein [Streptococcus sp.]